MTDQEEKYWYQHHIERARERNRFAYVMLLRKYFRIGGGNIPWEVQTSLPLCDLIDAGLDRVKPIVRRVMDDMKSKGQLVGAKTEDLSLLDFLELHQGERCCGSEGVSLPGYGRKFRYRITLNGKSEDDILELVTRYYVEADGFKPTEKPDTLINRDINTSLHLLVSEVSGDAFIDVSASQLQRMD